MLHWICAANQNTEDHPLLNLAIDIKELKDTTVFV